MTITLLFRVNIVYEINPNPKTMRTFYSNCPTFTLNTKGLHSSPVNKTQFFVVFVCFLLTKPQTNHCEHTHNEENINGTEQIYAMWIL